MQAVRPKGKTRILLKASKLTFFTLLLCSLQARAEESSDGLKARRCASRLSIALIGSSPAPALLADAHPESQVDRLLATPDFQERFARFLNSQFNDTPGTVPTEDAAYYLSKYILENNLPWKELFVGPYTVNGSGMMVGGGNAVVQSDSNGLGFFRSPGWVTRYAGNEENGIRLSAAYRMMQNIVGLKVSAEALQPNTDASASGRSVAPCKSCHYEKWYALDLAANILGKVTRMNNVVSIAPYTGAAREVLGGVMLKNEKEFVNALANSPDFLVHSCRLVFRYLYGRSENACEATLFDACIDALKSTGSIIPSLALVAKDPSFCQ